MENVVKKIITKNETYDAAQKRIQLAIVACDKAPAEKYYHQPHAFLYQNPVIAAVEKNKAPSVTKKMK